MNKPTSMVGIFVGEFLDLKIFFIVHLHRFIKHIYVYIFVFFQNGDKQSRQFVCFFGSFEIQNQLVVTHHLPNTAPNFEWSGPQNSSKPPRVLGGTTQPIWKEFACNSHQCNPVHHHTKTPSLPSTFPVLWPKWLSCQLSRTKKQCIRRTPWNLYNFYKSWHRFMHWNLIYRSIEYASKIYGPKGFGASDWYRSEMWIWKHTKITHVSIDGNHANTLCRITSSICIMTLLNCCET